MLDHCCLSCCTKQRRWISWLPEVLRPVRGSPRFARVKWAHPSQKVAVASGVTQKVDETRQHAGFPHTSNSVWDFFSNVEHCVPMNNHIIAEMPNISGGNVSNAGPSSRKEWQSDWTTMAPKKYAEILKLPQASAAAKRTLRKKTIQFGMCLLIHDSVKTCAIILALLAQVCFICSLPGCFIENGSSIPKDIC